MAAAVVPDSASANCREGSFIAPDTAPLPALVPSNQAVCDGQVTIMESRNTRTPILRNDALGNNWAAIIVARDSSGSIVGYIAITNDRAGMFAEYRILVSASITPNSAVIQYGAGTPNKKSSTKVPIIISYNTTVDCRT